MKIGFNDFLAGASGKDSPSSTNAINPEIKDGQNTIQEVKNFCEQLRKKFMSLSDEKKLTTCRQIISNVEESFKDKDYVQCFGWLQKWAIDLFGAVGHFKDDVFNLFNNFFQTLKQLHSKEEKTLDSLYQRNTIRRQFLDKKKLLFDGYELKPLCNFPTCNKKILTFHFGFRSPAMTKREVIFSASPSQNPSVGQKYFTLYVGLDTQNNKILYRYFDSETGEWLTRLISEQQWKEQTGLPFPNADAFNAKWLETNQISIFAIIFNGGERIGGKYLPLPDPRFFEDIGSKRRRFSGEFVHSASKLNIS